jgi:type III secretion system low calcium response chaperone LcrH/SycD
MLPNAHPTDSVCESVSEPETLHALLSGRLESPASLSDADCESLYAVGYGLYAQASYEKALQVFGWLVILRSLDRRYVFALGSCLQVVGRYESAINHYATALMIDIEDPTPLLHTCECLVALRRFDHAQEALDTLRQEYSADSYPWISPKAERLQALIAGSQAAETGRKL